MNASEARKSLEALIADIRAVAADLRPFGGWAGAKAQELDAMADKAAQFLECDA